MADVAVDLKEGHAPAAKVGARCYHHMYQIIIRMFQENVNPTAQDVKEFGEHKTVSVAKTGESDAFPKAAAVKAFHEKPQPTHEKPVNQKPSVIQQPRKC